MALRWRATIAQQPVSLAGLRAIALKVKCPHDYGRRRAVRRRILGLLAAESSQEYVEAHELRSGERLRFLDQAIAALPPFYKEPLLLTLVAGLTQEQVASELNTTSKAIEMRIRRAKRRLRRAL